MPSFRSQTAINGQKAQLPANSLRFKIKEGHKASFRVGGERVALCWCDHLSQQNEKKLSAMTYLFLPSVHSCVTGFILGGVTSGSGCSHAHSLLDFLQTLANNLTLLFFCFRFKLLIYKGNKRNVDKPESFLLTV